MAYLKSPRCLRGVQSPNRGKKEQILNQFPYTDRLERPSGLTDSIEYFGQRNIRSKSKLIQSFFDRDGEEEGPSKVLGGGAERAGIAQTLKNRTDRGCCEYWKEKALQYQTENFELASKLAALKQENKKLQNKIQCLSVNATNTLSRQNPEESPTYLLQQGFKWSPHLEQKKDCPNQKDVNYLTESKVEAKLENQTDGLRMQKDNFESIKKVLFERMHFLEREILKYQQGMGNRISHTPQPHEYRQKCLIMQGTIRKLIYIIKKQREELQYHKIPSFWLQLQQLLFEKFLP